MGDTRDHSIFDIICNNDSREELIKLKVENAKLKSNNGYLHEMLSESRQANEHLYTQLKRDKSILQARSNTLTTLYNENVRLKKIIAANIEDYSCNECPYEKDCDSDMVPMHDGCRMYVEIRKLGIEVNE